jgi:hypothetical protein
MLPAIGVALNGTSSVLYGTVPELATADQRQRALAFAMRERLGLELCLRHFVGCSATFSAFLPRCCSSQPWS